MIAETKEETLTNSHSKFEALLYQFIKLYDRLTVEHNLITERELKLIKNLEDFKEIILDLNNTTGNINVAIAELNKIELKLSPVIQHSISASIEKIRGDLLEVNRSSLDHSLLKCMQYCGDSLNYATDKIRELTIKQERSDVKLFSMLLGVCSLIGLLIGALFRLYAFK